MGASDCGFEVVPGTRLPEIPFHGTRLEQQALIRIVLGLLSPTRGRIISNSCPDS